MTSSSPTNAPPQMNRMLVVSIWRNSWWGCLRPPCGGHVGDGALEDLQQRLLHTLAGHIAGDGRVLGLARHLVDLVDVDDAPLRRFAVAIGRLVEPEQDVLHILADIAGLGEGGGVDDGERDLELARQGLGEQRLAGSGRVR